MIDRSPEVAVWVAAHIPGCERGWEKCRAFGVEHKGRLIGGIVYHDWSPECGIIEMSGASIDRRWLSRSILTEMLNYPFGFCQMIVGRHSPDGPARRIWKAVGADEHIVPRLFGRDRDGVISTLTDDQWAASPFNLGGRNGQT